MAAVSFEYGLALAAILFILGLVGLLTRRSLVFMLLCVEIMLNAAGFAFIVAGARWGGADGQVMFIFLLTMAAAEVAVGLALILVLSGRVPGAVPDEAAAGGEPAPVDMRSLLDTDYQKDAQAGRTRP